jgi:hypothetical protein
MRRLNAPGGTQEGRRCERSDEAQWLAGTVEEGRDEQDHKRGAAAMKLSAIATTTMAVFIHSTNSHAAATAKEGLNFATRDELRACQRLDEALAQRRENIEAMLT